MSERDIFTAAREMTDQAARSAYLDQACDGDAGTKARVEALLRAHDQPDSLLDHPAVSRPEPGQGPTQALSAPDSGHGSSEPAEDEVPLGFLEPPTRPDAMGRIGHYEVLQVLGKGGFGIVFRAFDDVLHRVVAVKVLSPQMAATSPARKRFLREARSSAQVRHENVVQVHEVGEQPLPYIAMEFIPGETLQQRLDRVGPVEPAEVVRVGRQVAEGLAAAHACDLIHRDIKPGNVLLEGGAQRVKLTDFGLARAADDASISQSGLIAGTPMYMAPEQAKGEKLDQRADLFSLGSVLYQMAAGRPPFRANGTVAVLKRVAEDTPRPIREVIPETPQWLCDIIAKLHAKNPDERYQSAREVADVLADCEAQLKANSKLKDYSRIPSSKPRRSGRRKWFAAAAVLLLPVIALAATEFAGVTHLFRQQATTDPDRKAAEYVLSIGGQVQVDDRDRNINAAAELPRDPFRLTWVGLKDSNQVSDAGLANFKECKNLTFLGLFDTSVSDEGLVNFQNCTRLTFLNLSRTKISDAGLANFKNCTELATVVLNETKVSDTGLDYLKNSKKLTKLFLQKTNVTAAGIDELKKALPLCKIEWDSGVSAPPRSTAVAWGQVTDPLGDCRFTEADGRLTIAVPGDRLHDLSPLPGGNLNSPRVLREVAGDFEARVTVLPYPRPTSVYSTGSNPPYVGAGLVVWSDEAGVLRLFRAYSGGSFVTPEWYNGLALGGQKWIRIPVPDGPMHLRIRRTGEALHLASSTDGQTWTEVATANNLRPASRVRVGVAVVNAIKQEFTVQFEGFEIKELPPSSLPPTFTNGIGMEFVIVPKGKSWLGGGKDKLGDQEVEIPADFYLGKYEVTQEEWEKVMGENPSWFSRTGNGKDAVKDISDVDLNRFPVENVSWEKCQLFVAKLNKLEKETGWVYRLPRELEWEYACRGGPMADKADSAFDYYFAKPSNTLLLEQANFSPDGDGKGGLARACKVGSYNPNKLALFDMHGNVWQWCADLHDPKASGPGASDRVGRGGGWRDSGFGCTAAYRYGIPASVMSYALGLRLARVPSGTPSPEAKTPAIAPFTDADVQRIAALPAEQQIEEVRKELMRRNPGFDGKVEHKIEDGAVTEFKIVTDQVTDIAPIRVFNALRVLECRGTNTGKPNGLLADLTPLEGMNLAGLKNLKLVDSKVSDAGMVYFKDCKDLISLDLSTTKVTDRGLAHFKNCKDLAVLGLTLMNVTDAGLVNFKDCKDLRYLHLAFSKVTDVGLTNFKDCKDLISLQFGGTQVSDAGLANFKDCKNLSSLDVSYTGVSDSGLANFKGIPLTELRLQRSGVTDLTPLQGMPLEEIRLTPKNVVRGLDILRDMKSLKTIGVEWNQVWPAAEFWQRYDKGEFKE